MSDYISPFGDPDADHVSTDDALCLSRDNYANPELATFEEYYAAALCTLDCHTPQPAFALTRHVAELGLKILHGPAHRQDPTLKRSHDLEKFLQALAARGDDLLGAGSTQSTIVTFIRQLAQLDRGGDQGRYPFTLQGFPSLSAACCGRPDALRASLTMLHDYVLARAAVMADGS